MRDRSSLETEVVPLVDLPAFASLSHIEEHGDVLRGQSSGSALRLRRLLSV